MFDFALLIQECAPEINIETVSSIVQVESDFNSYAIGVVGARLVRQPRNLEEAVATARYLEDHGYNFSVGLLQVNRSNFGRYALDLRRAFDPCENLRAGSSILRECFDAAKKKIGGDDQSALRAALSCFNTGNFTTGFRNGYVQRVVDAASANPIVQSIPVVPQLASGVSVVPPSAPASAAHMLVTPRKAVPDVATPDDPERASDAKVF
jgi:type IV secretion system protein VirB1